MSFLGPSQRGYDPLAHPDLSHLARLPMSSFSSLDNIPAAPLQQVLPPTMPSTHNQPPQHVPHLLDRTQVALPKVGETRCYWALLNSNLCFVYLDPVLANHLQEQADLLIGKSLLTFVHHDEQKSAEQDLGGVLESRTLHGSVTRVRYSRLSRVRRQLGYQGPGPSWQDADKIAVDANYMAVDIVINWAAEGVVLCFIHAVVDLTPHDNDEHHKTGWTNWCGTPYMGIEQVDFLHQRLRQVIPQPPSRDRVFQILLNQPDRPLWFSWPPDSRNQARGPYAKDFCQLAADVNINNQSAGGTDAKTSCTRRFKAMQKMEWTEESPEVESIFIPYGSIIFACHKVNNSTNKSGNAYPSSQYYDHNAYNLPPLQPPANYASDYSSPHTSTSYPSQSWTPGPDSASQSSYHQWTSQNTPISSSPSVSSMRSSSYAPSQATPQQQHQWSSQPPSFMEPNGASYSFPPGAAYAPTASASATTTGGSPGPGEDTVPASRNGHRRGSAANRDHFGSGGRGTGGPPIGVMQCISCKATQSPEWRKGPSGKKDLCNACGLRYARSRAKKEGGTQRRRKEKVLNAMSNKSDHSPSASPVNMPYNSMRRSSVYDEPASFAAGPSSMPPPSGNEVFSSQPTGLSGMTRSPSPPSATGTNFVSVSYAPHTVDQNSPTSEHRGHSQFQPSFYSIPPPMPVGPHGLQGGGHPSPNLPRLDPMMLPPFVSRMSPPMHSPTTPVTASSPLASHFSAPSYEREKQRGRERERGGSFSSISSEQQRKY